MIRLNAAARLGSETTVRVFLALLALLTPACLRAGGQTMPALGCDGPDGACARYVQDVDADGAPLDRATIVIPFTAPVEVSGDSTAVALTPVFDLATRQPSTRSVPVTLQADPHRADQVLIVVDGLLANGAQVHFPPGSLRDRRGRPLGPTAITLRTPHDPLDVALADVVWEPIDRSLFEVEGLPPLPAQPASEDEVRRELELRLRLRPGIQDKDVAHVLARYDDAATRRRVPHHRVRAGLLLLTDTSGQDAIDTLLASTTRDGLAIQPVQVAPLARTHGVFAYVQPRPLSGTLTVVMDSELAGGPLETIAVVLAHEAVHVGLGAGSATEETLAMALGTRVYEELLLWDPSLARVPTPLIRQQNRLLLALRNSGRYGYPRAGILPRPGIVDAVAGLGPEPVRSFRDLILTPHFYGDIPRTGAVGSQVLEQYYQRLSGDRIPLTRGSLRLDESTLKRFDAILDRNLTAEQVLTIVDTLQLTPIPKRANTR